MPHYFANFAVTIRNASVENNSQNIYILSDKMQKFSVMRNSVSWFHSCLKLFNFVFERVGTQNKSPTTTKSNVKQFETRMKPRDTISHNGEFLHFIA
jgi:hypothetical protein